VPTSLFFPYHRRSHQESRLEGRRLALPQFCAHDMCLRRLPMPHCRTFSTLGRLPVSTPAPLRFAAHRCSRQLALSSVLPEYPQVGASARQGDPRATAHLSHPARIWILESGRPHVGQWHALTLHCCCSPPYRIHHPPLMVLLHT
jgi:hypothetical protein